MNRAKIMYTCDECGKSFHRPPSAMRWKHHYCGNPCRFRANCKYPTAELCKQAALKRQNNWRIQRRLKCIAAYGGCCTCCGETQPEFLAIDHIDGGGGQHRKTIGGGIVAYLIKNKFPDGFRVLCHNCNMALGIYGYCPHTKGG